MKKITLIFLLIITQLSFSNNKKANTLIEKGIEYLHANNYAKAVETFNQTQLVLNDSYSYREQFLVYNNLGLIYYKMSEYIKATKYFELAYKLAKDENKQENEMTVLNNLAILFIKINKYEVAKKYLVQAYEIAREQNDLNKLAIYATNLASVNFELKDYSNCKFYLNKVAQLNHNKLDSHVLKSYNILLSNLLTYEGKTSEAIKNLENLLKNSTKEVFNDERYKIYVSLVIAHITEKEYNKALYNIQLAFKIADSDEKKKELFNHLSKIYFEKNEFSKAIQSKDSVIKYNEHIQKNINKESIENARLNFELTKSTYEIDFQKKELQKEKKFYLILILFAIILCVLIIFLLNKRNQNIKQKNQLIKQNLLLKEFEFNKLKESKELLLNEIKSLKKLQETSASDSENDEIRNQLLEKKMLLQLTKNELLTELLQEITENKEQLKPERIFEIIQKLKIHIQTDSDHLEQMYSHDINKDHFLINILKKHQNLNTNDIRLATLIYLKTDTKEIAQLLFITPETVRKRKERLKIKLAIEKKVDLYDYFHEIN